jgi:hypothetical protein
MTEKRMIYMVNKQIIEELTILDTDVVKIIPTLNNIDVRYTKKNENDPTDEFERVEKVIRVDKHTYLNPNNNEVKNYNHKTKRTENETTFFRSKRELNWLILNNFKGDKNEFFLTLTYSEKMDRPSQLSSDFRNFIKRLKTIFKNNLKFEYILVKEPSMSGSWHLHILLKYELLNHCSIDNISDLKDIIKRNWKKGKSHIKSIDNANKVASYLTSHLSNLVIDDCGQDTSDISFTTDTTKTIIKNSRLPLYPLNLKIYSSSVGIKKPYSQYMTYKECIKRYEMSHFKNWDTSFKLYNSNFAILQRQIQLTKY